MATEGKDIALIGGLAGVGFLLWQNKSAIEEALKNISGGFGEGGFLGGLGDIKLDIPDLNFDGVSNGINDFKTSIFDQFNEFKDSVVDTLKDAGNNVIDTVTAPVDAVKDAGGAVVDTVKVPFVPNEKSGQSYAGVAGTGGLIGAIAGGVTAIATGTIGAPIVGTAVAGAGTAILGEKGRRAVIKNTGQTPEQNIGSFWDRFKEGRISTGEWLGTFGTLGLNSVTLESAQTQTEPQDSLRNRLTDFYETTGENPNLWEKLRLAFGWEGYQDTKTAVQTVNLNAGRGANVDFNVPIQGVQTTSANAISQPRKTSVISSRSNSSSNISEKEKRTAGQKGSSYAKIIRRGGKVEYKKLRFA